MTRTEKDHSWNWSSIFNPGKGRFHSCYTAKCKPPIRQRDSNRSACACWTERGGRRQDVTTASPGSAEARGRLSAYRSDCYCSFLRSFRRLRQTKWQPAAHLPSSSHRHGNEMSGVRHTHWEGCIIQGQVIESANRPGRAAAVRVNTEGLKPTTAGDQSVKFPLDHPRSSAATGAAGWVYCPCSAAVVEAGSGFFSHSSERS